MDEAKESMSPRGMRHLFATLLIFNKPTDCLKLYQDYLRDMAEDILYRENKDEVDDEVENEVLLHIQKRLDTENLDLTRDFGLKAAVRPADSRGAIIDQELELIQGLAVAEVQDAHRTRVGSLNEDQRNVYDQVIHSVTEGNAGMFALNACGGSGKTYTINTIIDQVRSMGKVALATATSGIAGTLLHGGRTIHSRFKVGPHLFLTFQATFPNYFSFLSGASQAK